MSVGPTFERLHVVSGYRGWYPHTCEPKYTTGKFSRLLVKDFVSMLTLVREPEFVTRSERGV